tara:strand:+ start:230 stop:1375 length:1146 start_codon:yes stop_codon:yes gene_type:complete
MKIYDYLQLKNKYENELIEVLRDFNNYDANLSLWVPDEDPAKGISNLIMSVFEAGTSEVLITYDYNKNKTKVDTELIKNEAKNYGNISCKLEKNILKINFKRNDEVNNNNFLDKNIKRNNVRKKNKNIKKNSLRINYDDLYLSKASDYKTNNYNKELDSKVTGLFHISANNKFIELNLFINPESLKIVNCFYKLKTEKKYNSFFNLLCETIINVPIYEVKDHSLIIIENKLRPEKVKKEINGVIIPIYISDLFKETQELLDDAYIKSKSVFDGMPSVNEYDYKISEEWKNLNLNQKQNKVMEIINEFENENSIAKGDIFLEKIEFNTRIIVYIKDNKLDVQRILFNLENKIRSKIDKRLELFYSEMLDNNKLRLKNSPQNI